MKTFTILTIAFTFLFVEDVNAQELIDLPTAPRVDTTNTEIMEVYKLWRSHLSNHPEKIYDNPFWSEQQKNKWEDYDISRRWTYGYEVSNGMKIHDMFKMKPRVLSIEKHDSLYAIQTLYAPDNLENWQEIYSIQRVYAGLENGQWKLNSALPILTKNWNRVAIGNLIYVYPPTYQFDRNKAQDSAQFVESLQKEFNLSGKEPITYYLGRNYDEMAKISGLDYAWDGNDGRGYPKNRQVFVGTGSESYPHELVHAVFNDFELHSMISEGLATFYGGIGQTSFEELVKKVAEEVEADSTLTFDKAISGRQISAQNFYVGGAILLKAADDKGGVEAMIEFLNMSSSKEGIYEALEKVLSVTKEQANEFWRNKIIEVGT
jgi:hypothetical protein